MNSPGPIVPSAIGTPSGRSAWRSSRPRTTTIRPCPASPRRIAGVPVVTMRRRNRCSTPARLRGGSGAKNAPASGPVAAGGGAIDGGRTWVGISRGSVLSLSSSGAGRGTPAEGGGSVGSSSSSGLSGLPGLDAGVGVTGVGVTGVGVGGRATGARGTGGGTLALGTGRRPPARQCGPVWTSVPRSSSSSSWVRSACSSERRLAAISEAEIWRAAAAMPAISGSAGSAANSWRRVGGRSAGVRRRSEPVGSAS
jgi:hypothetical protein